MSQFSAPCFIVEQPFHETTPSRLVVDYSMTINPLMIPNPQPLDNMDDILFQVAGRKFKFKADVSEAFNTIPIDLTDMLKDCFCNFRRLPFRISIGPATMACTIKLAFAHLLGIGVSMYIVDIIFGKNIFTEHDNTIRQVVATTHVHFCLEPSKLIMTAEMIWFFTVWLFIDSRWFCILTALMS